MKLRMGVVLMAGLALTGCGKHAETIQPGPAAKTDPPMKAAPATPIAEKRDELGGKNWDPAWDVIVEKALPAELLSAKAASAVKSECPRFAESRRPTSGRFGRIRSRRSPERRRG